MLHVAFGERLCRSVVPFLSSFSFLFPPSRRSLMIFIPYRPTGVYRRFLNITRFPKFLSSTCQRRICPTRVGLISSCLPLIPCRAVIDSLLTSETHISLEFAGQQLYIIGGTRQGQAMGPLPLHDSCFALAYPLPTSHTLPLSLLTSAYTMVPFSRDRRLPFSRT